MSRRTNDFTFSSDDRALVRQKIKRLTARGFSREDGNDLEQSLLVCLWLALSSNAPARGNRRAFVARVLDNHIAQHFSARRAAKRQPRSVRSLDEAVTMTDRRRDAGLGELEETLLAVDVAAALARLEPALRDVAKALMFERTVADAARRLKLNRGTVYRRIARLRRALRKLES